MILMRLLNQVPPVQAVILCQIKEKKKKEKGIGLLL